MLGLDKMEGSDLRILTDQAILSQRKNRVEIILRVKKTFFDQGVVTR